MGAETDTKSREISELRAQLSEKGHQVTNLEERISDLLAVVNRPQLPSQEHASHLRELRDRLQREARHFESIILAKDQLILELRTKLAEARREPQPGAYDLEFYGSVQQQTLTLTDPRDREKENRFSSIKRPEDEQIKRLAQEQANKIQDLESEISQLRQELEIKDADLATYASRLRRLESELTTSQASQTSAVRHAAALAEKDEIIEKLEASIRELKQKYEVGYAELQVRHERLQRRHEELSQEKALLESRREFSMAPTVERVEKGVHEVRYQPDPFVLEQNSKLSLELKASLDNERRAHHALELKVAEISSLNVPFAQQKLIAELKATPKVLEKFIEPDPKQLSALAKLQVDSYIKRHRKTSRREHQRLVLLAWHYFSKARKLHRALLTQQAPAGPIDRVLIRQKLEVVDGTLQVWQSIRAAIVSWVYSIFLSSNHHLNQKKT